MLKDIKYIYTVYQQKSFSKAAEKLYISQPALSAKIKKIESEIQIAIFDRTSNPIQLTPAGEYYIESIEKIMEIQKDMVEYFNTLTEEQKGTINVGSATYFCAHIMPKLLQEFQDHYPNYQVNLLETNASELAKYLRSGDIDLSLGVEVFDSSIFQGITLKKEHIVLAVPDIYEINNILREYRLSFEVVRSKEYIDPKYPAVNMKYFENEPFLMLKKGNDMYKRGLKICRNAGYTPIVSMYLDQLLTSYYVAYNGKGIAFIRAGITQHVEATDKLFFYKIDDENAIRNIMLHYKKTTLLSNVAEDFITFLEGNSRSY